jgi:hypothetical protein
MTTTFTPALTFAELMLIDRALLASEHEMRDEARRGERCGNDDMRDHYQDAAAARSALREKLRYQCNY